MSDALEKILGIKQLPLFPLPLVLMPNEVLPLHIFEPRYRQMLKDIELRKNLFGITLFEQEGTILDRPKPGTVGCAAEVRETSTLPDGRSNILAAGVIRYRLVDYVETGDPYFVGEVEFFEDDPDDDSVVQPLADDVFDLFERIAKVKEEKHFNDPFIVRYGWWVKDAVTNEFGTTLLRTTGTSEFVEAFGTIAKARHEKDVFKKAGIPFVEPERRETAEDLKRKKRTKLSMRSAILGLWSSMLNGPRICPNTCCTPSTWRTR